MKHLILIRHAKSSWDDPDADDHDRELSERGLRDAPIMAARLADTLKRLDIQLEQVLSSTAKRAFLYAEEIGGACKCPVTEQQSLYTFSTTSLLSELRSLPSQFNCVAVVGHNPAMTYAANSISAANLHNMPTAAFLLLECDIENWCDLIPSSTSQTNTEHKILEFNFPKKDNT